MPTSKPPQFVLSNDDLYKEAPIGFFGIESYKANLLFLEEYVTRRDQNVIVIFGPHGFGKTVLPRQLAVNLKRSHPSQFEFEWLPNPELRNLSDSIEGLIEKIRADKTNSRVVAVIEEPEFISAQQIQVVVNRLLNWKRIKTVIITTTSDELRLAGAGYVEITPPDGKLYGLSEQLIIPGKRILTSVAPLIVTANDGLIEKLKREPAGALQNFSKTV